LENDKNYHNAASGASTAEAQEGVALIVAEQMRDYFAERRCAARLTLRVWRQRILEAFPAAIDLAENLISANYESKNAIQSQT